MKINKSGDADQLPLPTETDSEFNPTNAALFKLLLVFQIRLLLDGLRDVVLSPVSLLAVLLDLLSSRNRRGQYFEMLCYWGHKSDQWINLFGLPEKGLEDDVNSATRIPGVDSLVDNIEQAVRDGTLRKENRAALRSRIQQLVKSHLE